ncbi:hypothetical protein [Nannocystis pusilla]|uniref:hypothetical protein n=1 Tax=Nannocystis pusilla TaxID=889268 RepID=UPI003B817F8B
MIDLSKVKASLIGVPDADPPGHVSIRPGEALTPDVLKSLENWAGTRGTNTIHEYTQALLDAIVDSVKRPK